jgi:predicted nucleotidyltransferase
MYPEKLLSDIVTEYHQILGELLAGFYVHGSIAFGCYNSENSDIDFIVVVRDMPSQKMKENMISLLIQLEDEAIVPAKGFEMSVVSEKVCRDFVYPTPYYLHYSNYHGTRARADLASYCVMMNGVDYDLAAHFTVIKSVGICLYGPEAVKIFGEIKREFYVDSILRDISAAKSEIYKNPVYYILNLCRVLAYQKDGLILSKKGGGEWAIKNCRDLQN